MAIKLPVQSLNRRSRQQGFSLLEVLIASALGSLMLALALSSIVQSQLSFKTISARQQLQNDAQYALQTLRNHLLPAGYFESDQQTVNHFIYRGTCSEHSHCTFDGGDDSAVEDSSDQIAIIHDPINNRDCTNQSQNINNTDIIANVFWVQINSNNQQSLYCRGFNISQNQWVVGGRPLALVDGISNVQFQYLSASGTAVSQQRYQYLNADQVQDWSQIKAITIDLIASADDLQQLQLKSTVVLINAL